MANTSDRNRKNRTPFANMADQLYPEDSAPEDAIQDGLDPVQSNLDRTPSLADRMHPDSDQRKDSTAYDIPNASIRQRSDTGTSPFGGKDDSNCFKPEDQFDRIAKMALDQGGLDKIGLPEYVGKFDLAMVKGAASLFRDIFNGSKDTGVFFLDLSGSNGEDAQNKAYGQLGTIIDGTKEGGAAAYRGLRSYFTNPEIRDAVNSAIQKRAPAMWDKFQEFAGDPEKAGRLSGRVLLSGEMKATTKSESAASAFLKVLAVVGSLDTKGKDIKSRVDGLLFGSGYAKRTAEQSFQ